MLEAAFAAIAFWRKDRRKELVPVPVERRRISTAKAQKQLMQSVERLNDAVARKCDEIKK